MARVESFYGSLSDFLELDLEGDPEGDTEQAGEPDE